MRDLGAFLGDVEEELRTAAVALKHERDAFLGHAPQTCRKCGLVSLADEAADRHAAMVAEGVSAR